jgi:hypothetical protein
LPEEIPLLIAKLFLTVCDLIGFTVDEFVLLESKLLKLFSISEFYLLIKAPLIFSGITLKRFSDDPEFEMPEREGGSFDIGGGIFYEEFLQVNDVFLIFEFDSLRTLEVYAISLLSFDFFMDWGLLVIFLSTDIWELFSSLYSVSFRSSS